MDKRGRTKIWIIVLFMIVFVAAIYFTFIFSYTCEDEICFKAHQTECSRTTFQKETSEAVWYYKIQGKSNERCNIYAEFVKANQGEIEIKRLEGKGMVCSLELGSINDPEADLSLCHGVLKEELQTIIINKLHTYVVSNLGSINSDLGSVVGSSVPITRTNQSQNSSA